MKGDPRLVRSFFGAAQRSLSAAKTLRAEGAPHEAATFQACHAFEQAGSALFVSCGHTYVEKQSHEKRARKIANVAHVNGVGGHVSVAASKVISLRRASLYPEREAPWRPPSERVSKRKAYDLVSSVTGVVNAIDRYLSL